MKMSYFQLLITTPNGKSHRRITSLFNNQLINGRQFHSDRILTGSFDKTAKIWNPTSGNCLNTLWGHTAEIVAAEFNPNLGEQVVTCSMDKTARVFHAETGQEIQLLGDHKAEVISARFNKDGNLLLTASFDETAIVWDLRMKE